MEERTRSRGWKFPVRVDAKTGRILMSDMETDIRESILLILKTNCKERLMRPGFGSNVRRYVFESADSSTYTLIEQEVKRAILNWEPRVTDVEVTASPDAENTERILVVLKYMVAGERKEQEVVL